MHGPKFLSVLLGLVSVPVASVMAQSSAYGQCGGNGWEGPSTCVSGYTCTYSNDWYSQCIPGAADTTTTSSTASNYTSSAAAYNTTSTPTSSTASTPASTPTGATVLSGQWDNVQTSNNYILYNNLWGMSAATSGSQSTTLLSNNGTTISWKTAWSWAGGQYNVKSFANAKLMFTPKKISEISTIPSKMEYTYTGDSMVADVAYDIFTASTSGGDAEYEVMIWLASYGGAGPISSTGSPVVSGLSLAGQTWNLFKGPNGSMTVFSFVVTSNGGVVSNFSGDAQTFLTFLTTNQTMPASQYVNTVQCGTEPFTGSNAVLTVSAFSVAVN